MTGPAWGQGYGQTVDELGITLAESIPRFLCRIDQKAIQDLCRLYEIYRGLISLIFLFLSTANRMR
jgi:hypothetical protein